MHEHEDIRYVDATGTEHVGNLLQCRCCIGFVVLPKLCRGRLVRNRIVAEKNDIDRAAEIDKRLSRWIVT